MLLSRAEVLHRCGIRPFDRARDVLVVKKEDGDDSSDLLRMCSRVMAEVLELPGTGVSLND